MPNKNVVNEITFINKLMWAHVGQKTLGGSYKHVEEMGVG